MAEIFDRIEEKIVFVPETKQLELKLKDLQRQYSNLFSGKFNYGGRNSPAGRNIATKMDAIKIDFSDVQKLQKSFDSLKSKYRTGFESARNSTGTSIDKLSELLTAFVSRNNNQLNSKNNSYNKKINSIDSEVKKIKDKQEDLVRKTATNDTNTLYNNASGIAQASLLAGIQKEGGGVREGVLMNSEEVAEYDKYQADIADRAKEINELESQRQAIELKQQQLTADIAAWQEKLKQIKQEAYSAGADDTKELEILGRLRTLIQEITSKYPELDINTRSLGLDGTEIKFKNLVKLYSELDKMQDSLNNDKSLKAVNSELSKLQLEIAKLTVQKEELIKKQEEENKQNKENQKSTSKATKKTKGFSGALGTLLDRFKRIAVYKIINTIINGITKSIKEGISNVYQYSKALKSLDSANFSSIMDTYATKLLTFKNSIGAAAAQIMSVVIPVLNKFLSTLTTCFNALSKFFALVNGKSTYTAAIDYTQEWAKATTNLKKLISGFDELNIFSDNDTNTDASKMFEERSTGLGDEDDTEDKLTFLDNLQSKFSETAELIKQKWAEVKESFKLDDNTIGNIKEELITIFGIINELLQPAISLVAFVIDVANYLTESVLQSDTLKNTLSKFEDITAKIQEWIDNIIATLGPPIKKVIDTILPVILEAIDLSVELFGDLTDYVTTLMGDCEWLSPIIEYIAGELKKSIEYVITSLATFHQTIKPILTWVLEQVNSILGVIGGIFSIINGIKNMDLSSIGKGLEMVLKNVAAMILGILDSFIEPIVGIINSLLTAVNKVLKKDITLITYESLADKVKAQDWGWSNWGTSSTTTTSTTVNTTTHGKLSAMEERLNAYATGGIITSPQIGLLGEYSGASRNPEIVSPQSLMKETMDSSNSQVVSAMLQCCKQLISTIENKDTTIKINDEQIAQSAARGNNSFFRRNGVALI